jgi:hypothetical protein
MTIAIKQLSPVYKMTEDGEFKCQHIDLSIDEMGVYCYDCKNIEMSWGEAQDMFDNWEQQNNLGFDESDCNE